MMSRNRQAQPRGGSLHSNISSLSGGYDPQSLLSSNNAGNSDDFSFRNRPHHDTAAFGTNSKTNNSVSGTANSRANYWNIHNTVPTRNSPNNSLRGETPVTISSLEKERHLKNSIQPSLTKDEMAVEQRLERIESYLKTGTFVDPKHHEIVDTSRATKGDDNNLYSLIEPSLKHSPISRKSTLSKSPSATEKKSQKTPTTPIPDLFSIGSLPLGSSPSNKRKTESAFTDHLSSVQEAKSSQQRTKKNLSEEKTGTSTSKTPSFPYHKKLVRAQSTDSNITKEMKIEFDVLDRKGKFVMSRVEPRTSNIEIESQTARTLQKKKADLRKVLEEIQEHVYSPSAALHSFKQHSSTSLTSNSPPFTNMPILNKDSIRNIFTQSINMTKRNTSDIVSPTNQRNLNNQFIEATVTSFANSNHSSEEAQRKQEKPISSKFGEQYEFESLESLLLNECPEPITSATMIAFPAKRKLCLFGGMTESGPTNETWLFEIGLQKWIRVQPSLSSETNKQTTNDTMNATSHHSVKPSKRFGHCAAVYDSNTMYMFGGGDLERRILYNDLWVFKPDPFPVWKCISNSTHRGNDDKTPPGMPCPRIYCAGVMADDLFFVHGGEGANFKPLSDLCVFSRSKNEWIPILNSFPRPSARFLHTATLLDHHKLVIIGGNNNTDEMSDTVWIMDTRSLYWKEVKTKNIGPFVNGPLYGHTASVWGNRILVFGGVHGKSRLNNEKVWLLDVDASYWVDISDKWHAFSELPTSRFKHVTASDFFSHITCNTYRANAREELLELSKHQISRYSEKADCSHSYDVALLRMPTDTHLQKMTRLYIFGGMQNNKRLNELWELSLTFSPIYRANSMGRRKSVVSYD
ncbi:hypothetical protein FDP41_009216 [Naegleria fowleri]|uniref:Tip elongation aberrant protein 1 n=1 Tax=Naegleria fowleri TaxID=5763 RepID=A0A6A5AWX6_NAEFO|nr:uncharacterized protein FDP41_009216 [Naegleria fowleri]KAF0972313.1 hypothetical protein FDP41_009216 [Naegleria fowleri]CAG4709081.1 unnamed protein product [Naegleria fowleri]